MRFSNPGVLCYMNCASQIIFCLLNSCMGTKFGEALSAARQEPELSEEEDTGLEWLKKIQHCRRLWAPEEGREVLTSLQPIHEQLCDLNGWDPSQQQDADEALKFALCSLKRFYKNIQASLTIWRSYTRICSSCGKQSAQDEPDVYPSVEVSCTGECEELETLLTRPPPPAASDCPACGVKAFEETRTLAFGPHAIILLQRYGDAEGLRARVTLPDSGFLVLRTRNEDGSGPGSKNALYQLKGAVLHKGSPKGGHYTVALDVDTGRAPGEPELWQVGDAPSKPRRFKNGWADASEDVYILLLTRRDRPPGLRLTGYQEKFLPQPPAHCQSPPAPASTSPTSPTSPIALLRTEPSPVCSRPLPCMMQKLTSADSSPKDPARSSESSRCPAARRRAGTRRIHFLALIRVLLFHVSTGFD